MNETIKKMREYLQLNDDWYVSKQLDILEKQIQLEIDLLMNDGDVTKVGAGVTRGKLSITTNKTL